MENQKFPLPLPAGAQPGMFASLLSSSETASGHDAILLAMFDYDLRPQEIAAVARGNLEIGIIRVDEISFLTVSAFGRDGTHRILTYDAPYHPSFDRDPHAAKSAICRLRNEVTPNAIDAGGTSVLVSTFGAAQHFRVIVMLCDLSSHIIQAQRIVHPSEEWAPYAIHFLSTMDDISQDDYVQVVAATSNHFPSPNDIHNAGHRFFVQGVEA